MKWVLSVEQYTFNQRDYTSSCTVTCTHNSNMYDLLKTENTCNEIQKCSTGIGYHSFTVVPN